MEGKRYNKIVGLDPGQEKTGMVIIRIDPFSISFIQIVSNVYLLKFIDIINNSKDTIIICESITSYGMEIGQTTIDTIYWIGRIYQQSIINNIKIKLIPRKDVKLHLCGTYKAKDKNIHQALIDRYGKKGTKKNKGILYGISNHTWSALAIATTYIEQEEIRKKIKINKGLYK